MEAETAQSCQIVAARGLLGWSQPDLASAAGISVSTIKRLEAGKPATAANRRAALAALEKAGVEFTNGDEPGVKLKAKGKLK